MRRKTLNPGLRVRCQGSDWVCPGLCEGGQGLPHVGHSESQMCSRKDRSCPGVRNQGDSQPWEPPGTPPQSREGRGGMSSREELGWTDHSPLSIPLLLSGQEVVESRMRKWSWSRTEGGERLFNFCSCFSLPNAIVIGNILISHAGWAYLAHDGSQSPWLYLYPWAFSMCFAHGSNEKGSESVAGWVPGTRHVQSPNSQPDMAPFFTQGLSKGTKFWVLCLFVS